MRSEKKQKFNRMKTETRAKVRMYKNTSELKV